MTYFDVRIPGLKMTVVAADGQYVHPVTVDEFRLAVAETMDVIVEPSGQDAFTIFAQSVDRTGYARGTLAVREGLSAPVPDLDPRALITMADMGMGHDMSAMAGHDMARDGRSRYGGHGRRHAVSPRERGGQPVSGHADDDADVSSERPRHRAP